MSKPKTTRRTHAAARAKKSNATAQKPAQQSRPPRAKTPKALQSGAPTKARAGTKQALLIDLLKRKRGATIDEIAKATGWQPPSVRGAISGTLKKKLGLAVSSEKAEGRDRVYRIAAGG